ncbi:MAG: ABC transporter permease [Jiangellaceae bacterium]
MSTLTGTRTLVRFFLRRDRLMIPVWVIGSVLLYVSQAASVEGLYPTQAEFDAAAAAMESNAAFIAMAGPARVLNTVGGQVAWQASAFGAIVAGLMSMFLIGRHTRAEEESGRDELIRSGVVGRHAPLTAALIVTTGANVLLGAAITASLVGYDLPVAGSVSLGAAAAAAGLVFMGVAALAAQITESARVVYGVTGAVIGISYVLRGVGDIGNGVLSWLSPIGWGQAMRAYADEIWWPLLISLGVAIVLVIGAVQLLDRRDAGAGLIQPKPGPERAGKRLSNEFGLAWTLQRGTLIGWAGGLFLAGLAYGSIGTNVDDIIGSTPGARESMAQAGGDLVDSFYSTTAMVIALIACGFAISATLRLRSEEAAGRVEPLLATRLSRWRWVASHLVIALGGTALIVGLGGLGTGIAYGITSSDASQVGRLFAASLVHIPAVWVLSAVAVAIFGLIPRLAFAAWAAMAFCVVVSMFGALLNLPQWVMNLSPFSHTPLLPSEAMALGPVLAVTLAAAGLIALGFVGFRRRDIQTS